MRERQVKGGDGRLVVIATPAGVGSSKHLREMRRGRGQAKHKVCGTAVAWQAARVLHGATGIRCQALVSLEADIHASPDTGCAADPLTGQDVVVVDETRIGRRRKAKLKAAVRNCRGTVGPGARPKPIMRERGNG